MAKIGTTSVEELEKEVEELTSLNRELLENSEILEKLEILNENERVKEYLSRPSAVKTFLSGLTPECDYAIKSILVIGQGDVVFLVPYEMDDQFERLRVLLQTVLQVEQFYDSIGGIIGYHLQVLKLLCNQGEELSLGREESYSKAEGFDISNSDEDVLAGIEALPEMAEIFPVGGAGDRLSLYSDEGVPLPAAALQFQGRSLLEGLIRDLQGKEFLYYKLFGKQLTTPIAMMTSKEKDNNSIIRSICEKQQWFGRGEESFRLFEQPLVPVINEEGNWSLKGPLELSLKPGGHGAIWKVASDRGVFDWLRGKWKRRKGIVKQINNPLAAVDSALFAFVGIGWKGDKTFGFASCSRLMNTAEGVIVAVEENSSDRYSYKITNIEYTDFDRKGVEEQAISPGSDYSIFPCNTNILFVDLEQVEKAAITSPIPGMTINLKHQFPTLEKDGSLREVRAGRLESMMQNIADQFTYTYDHKLTEEELKSLATYVTYERRDKMISVTKNSYKSGGKVLETPVGAFYDLTRTVHDLLKEYCGVDLPEKPEDTEAFVEKGPPFIFSYHPALGPLYEIIGKKLSGGRWKEGAELQLEIADVAIENLQLSGSLVIKAENVLGRLDEQGSLKFGEAGKCTLKNVQISNRGIDREATTSYWDHRIERKELVEIELEGCSEFYAEEVCLTGSHRFVVPDGKKMTVYKENGAIKTAIEPLLDKRALWNYSIDREISKVVLEKN